MLNPDDICEAFSDKEAKINIKFLDETSILFEGNKEGLRFLGNLFLAMAEAKDNGFQLSPHGAGTLFFADDAQYGLYLHQIT